jgi:hypothetical protein
MTGFEFKSPLYRFFKISTQKLAFGLVLLGVRWRTPPPFLPNVPPLPPLFAQAEMTSPPFTLGERFWGHLVTPVHPVPTVRAIPPA